MKNMLKNMFIRVHVGEMSGNERVNLNLVKGKRASVVDLALGNARIVTPWPHVPGWLYLWCPP